MIDAIKPRIPPRVAAYAPVLPLNRLSQPGTQPSESSLNGLIDSIEQSSAPELDIPQSREPLWKTLLSNIFSSRTQVEDYRVILDELNHQLSHQPIHQLSHSALRSKIQLAQIQPSLSLAVIQSEALTIFERALELGRELAVEALGISSKLLTPGGFLADTTPVFNQTLNMFSASQSYQNRLAGIQTRYAGIKFTVPWETRKAHPQQHSATSLSQALRALYKQATSLLSKLLPSSLYKKQRDR